MYIFFIRQFPDLDHATPIIYKMVQKGSTEIMVLFQNLDYDIHNNFITKYLKVEFGIESQYSYNPNWLSKTKRSFAVFLLWLRRSFPKIGVKLFKRLQHLLYDEKWAESLLSHLNASALIFDFHRDYKFSTKFLIQAAKKIAVPAIAINHGVTMRIPEITENTQIFDADYKICANKHQVEFFIKPSDSKNYVDVLGSGRYCDEWERVYNTLLSNIFSCQDLPDDKSKLNLLFFERPKIGFRSDHKVIEEVGELDFVQVILKGKPKIKYASSNILGFSYPSARLIQWANVVVMSTSSIALEVLWQGKTLIYLKYLAPQDICVFEQYKACWVVNSSSELIEALKKIQLNPAYRPYHQEDVERLFEYAVYAGNSKRDVLADYAELIINSKTA